MYLSWDKREAIAIYLLWKRLRREESESEEEPENYDDDDDGGGGPNGDTYGLSSDSVPADPPALSTAPCAANDTPPYTSQSTANYTAQFDAPSTASYIPSSTAPYAAKYTTPNTAPSTAQSAAMNTLPNTALFTTPDAPAVAEEERPTYRRPPSFSRGAVRQLKRRSRNGLGGSGSRRSKPYTLLWLREQREERRTRERMAIIECLKEQLRQSNQTLRAGIQHDTQVLTAMIRAIAQIQGEASVETPQPSSADEDSYN